MWIKIMLQKNLFAAKIVYSIINVLLFQFTEFFLFKKKYSLNYQDFMYIPFRASYHNRVVSSNLGDWSHFEKLLMTLLSQTIILINVNV